MYSEEHEDPLYTKLSKILELTSLAIIKIQGKKKGLIV